MNWKRLYLVPAVLLVSLLTVNNIQAQINPSEPQLQIPNVFTPNGDGVNDTFHITVNYGSWELMIFDRWGSLIFATQQGQGAAWNGVNLQGEACATAVYFYTLKDFDSGESYHGSIQLFR
jgi:gliding motility-associated-like protein